ncbi:annexin A7-like [Octopus vulgaris]|uniref:Annexin A7-like n=1 Tax=Octopus vulgaris TaxID=6645 RepID=A0AA36AQ37_OCTVU|nr:annexin A7-like [Octopus vulgaris]
MEDNNKTTEEPENDPPEYSEKPGNTPAFANPLASEHPGESGYPPPPAYEPPPGYEPQPGYPPQFGFPPPHGYPPQPGYPPQFGYPPQPGYQPQLGYAPQPGYPSQPPIVQQALNQQHQNPVILPNQQSQYVDDKLTAAILVTIFCFFPTGIPAIIFAYQANSMARMGNIADANDANVKAIHFIRISVIFGFIIMLGTILPLIIVFSVVSGIN